jgi:hypothetical protein
MFDVLFSVSARRKPQQKQQLSPMTKTVSNHIINRWLSDIFANVFVGADDDDDDLPTEGGPPPPPKAPKPEAKPAATPAKSAAPPGGGGGGGGEGWEGGDDLSDEEEEAGGAVELNETVDETEEDYYDASIPSVLLTISGAQVTLDIEIQVS